MPKINCNVQILQTKFSSRVRGWSDTLCTGSPCTLKVRLETHIVKNDDDDASKLQGN